MPVLSWSEAEADCTLALSFDPKYVKAYARRAHARLAQRKISAALEGTPPSGASVWW